MIKRRKTKQVKIGNLFLGSGFDILIQSMTNKSAHDIKGTLEQIDLLVNEGCEIVRVSIPDAKSLNIISEFKKQYNNIPIVADIHFDYKMAIASIEQGADKIRINPGNVGSDQKLNQIIDCAASNGAAIRIGVNGGSMPNGYEQGELLPIVNVALDYIEKFEKRSFQNLILSLKTSDVNSTVLANQQVSCRTDYPLHLGVTEAGTIFGGTIRSSIGIGSLLMNGIGDTVRVSLTGDPVAEIPVAKEILQSLGLRCFSPRIISCPTCGRTNVNLEKIALEVEKKTKHINKPISIAVMGCAVNGPGEAKHADYGVACGKNEGLIFSKGKIIKKVSENQIIDALLDEIS